MHTGRAFMAGIGGALVMTIVMLGFASMGIHVAIESRLAAVLGLGTWAVGFAAHLLIGGLIGLAYAYIFEHVLHQSGIGVGLLLGACNTIFAGFVWAALGGPGAFWATAGPLGVIALFLSHLAYGAVVGGLYRSDQVPIYG
jgi:hypothetical protein